MIEISDNLLMNSIYLSENLNTEEISAAQYIEKIRRTCISHLIIIFIKLSKLLQSLNLAQKTPN
ncbi:unnamed protein product (macronuclear) [Paramecium tetraurelia]|uniref:Uncharacterized protein n=1 Tax=Paramecium tetraurelia TaxID=5888 RepID=A0D8J1_PARTE|nr:uncharacterized protein GSPATT00014304001 [Paramecium tetraurelia]CAK79358.1 unnamed protein product [Paramecium tetraurelia]|eukprot:XP_001446755.1 hypothetical protein (macronuclear) [Paramecium tetraurelia strain d4-2]